MNKKNILLIAFLGILLIIFFWSKGKDNLEKRVNLFNFKQSDVTRIEFIEPQPNFIMMMDEGDGSIPTQLPTLSIYRENGEWFVRHPRNVRVRQAQIDRFFDEFLTLTVSSNSITDSVDRQTFYQVNDETGLQILIYGRQDKLLKKVYHGRSQNNHQIAYIRADRDRNIHQIDNIFSALNPTLHAWRDNMIFRFTPDQITSVLFDAFSISQEAGNWAVTIGGDTSGISDENPELTRILNAIVNLTSTTFWDDVYENYAEKLADPTIEMQISLNTGQTHHLRISENDASSFVLQVDENTDTLYRLTQQQINQLTPDPAKLANSE
jgi:hypothetical protein